MGCMKFTDLRCKEVICMEDGRRLGFVTDIKIEIPDGRISAIIVPGPCHFLGLFGRREDYVIPWECIRRIGPDILFVEIKQDQCRVPRHKLWA